MHIGFILTKSPSEMSFSSFIKFAELYQDNDQISIYLVGNSVYCARKGNIAFDKIKKLLNNSKIYANSDDLKARGILTEHLINGVIPFSHYDQVVIDIMENFDQTLSF